MPDCVRVVEGGDYFVARLVFGGHILNHPEIFWSVKLHKRYRDSVYLTTCSPNILGFPASRNLSFSSSLSFGRHGAYPKSVWWALCLPTNISFSFPNSITRLAPTGPYFLSLHVSVFFLGSLLRKYLSCHSSTNSIAACAFIQG